RRGAASEGVAIVLPMPSHCPYASQGFVFCACPLPTRLALLWQIFCGTGFPNQFFGDSWVVGFWRGRPWLSGHLTGRRSSDGFSSRFWLNWVTRRAAKCALCTCQG